VKKLCVLAVLLAIPCLTSAEDRKETKVSGPLSYKMKGIDGKEVDLSTYKGKVVLFVNVASKCGYTPQYTGLQKLHEKYNKEGLVIIGVPCNQFGKQEPGSDKEIAEFCSANYSVTFPLLSKVDVNGGSQCELYKFLTSKDTNPTSSGPIRWNFTKFLINKKGEIVQRFESKVKPEQIAEAIETELKK
jgi:glutathione peroxidase